MSDSDSSGDENFILRYGVVTDVMRNDKALKKKMQNLKAVEDKKREKEAFEKDTLAREKRVKENTDKLLSKEATKRDNVLAVTMSGITASNAHKAGAVEEKSNTDAVKNLIQRADDEIAKGNLKNAADLLEEAFISSQEDDSDSERFKMSLANRVAVAFKEVGEIRLALQYFHEALGIAKAIGDVPNSGKIYSNIASAHQYLGEIDLANACRDMALAIAARGASDASVMSKDVEPEPIRMARSLGLKAAAEPDAGPAVAAMPARSAKAVAFDVIDSSLLDSALDSAKLGDFAKVLSILKSKDSGSLLNYQHSRVGATAMMLACAAHRVDIVQLLLDMGASANLTDHMGQNALYWSCRFGSAAAVDMLLSRGSTFTSHLTAEDLKLFKPDVLNAILKHSGAKAV